MTFRNALVCMALAVMLALSAAAYAGEGSAPAAKSPAENPAFKKFQDDGGKIEFIGNSYGIDGWLLINKDGKIVTPIYTTPDGAFLKGWLFDPAGMPVTRKQIDAYKARLNGSQAAVPGAEKGNGVSAAETVYAQVEKSNWVRVGSKDAPYLYMFMNVGCPHCQELWKKLQPSVKAGALQVRLIPFGKEQINRDGGAALLSVDNPGEAWQQFIDGKQEVLAKEKIKDGMLKKIDENSRLVKDTGIPGPLPFSIYRKLSDGTVTAIVGQPDNVMVVQADLMKSEN